MVNHSSPPPVLDLLASLKKPFQWAFAAGLLSAFVTLLMPNYYRSESRMLPVESKGVGGTLGGLASAAATLGVSVPGGDSSDANFVDVLNSRWLKEQLLQTDFRYQVRSWRFGPEHVEQGTLYGYLEARNMDQAVNGLGTILSSSRDLKSKIISISAETRSPELSQLIVKRAGALLEVFLQVKGRTRGSAKADFAKARLIDARREMEEAESSLRHFLEANRNFNISGDPSVRLTGSRLETELRLRQQLVSAIAMNREQALLEEKNDIPILNILDPANLPIDKSRPNRSLVVVFITSMVGLSIWIWLNRFWIRAMMLAGE